ncbi:flippase [Pokkaliibacter sp. CJK22405]|uniref:flippase n=1 Tax=Pokkaliibacter sp. CJK22405 TaxID=3384615 RepID=UPI003984B38B
MSETKGVLHYFKNSGWLFSEKLLRMFSGIFVGAWVARYLGPEEFGTLNYAQSIIAIFLAIASLGIDNIFTREIIKFPEKKKTIIFNSLLIKLLGYLLMCLFVGIYIYSSSDTYKAKQIIAILLIGYFFQIFSVFDLYYQSELKGRLSTLASIAAIILSSIAKVICVEFNLGLFWIAAAFAVDTLILSIGLLLFMKTEYRQLEGEATFDKELILNILQDSWPLIFTGTVIMLQARIDQFMLAKMFSEHEVGLYSSALRIVEAASFVPMIIKSTFFPKLVSAHATGEENYRQALTNFYRLNFILFIFITGSIALASYPIADILYGKEYTGVGFLLFLMSFRMFFTNMGVARSVFLVNENMTTYSFISMGIGTLTNVSLNYLLIPNYGALGAIITTYISFLVSIFLIDLLYKKSRKNVLCMIYSIITFWKFSIKRLVA